MRSGPEGRGRALTPSGTTRPAPGRRTTASASIICCCRRRPPIGSSPPESTSTCAAGERRRMWLRFGRASDSVVEEAVQDIPRQVVVHPDANDVVVEVQTLIARKCRVRRRGEIGFVLQSHVEIFNLRRPVLTELDLEAAACGPAPMPLLVRDGAGGSADAVRDVGERATGGGVEEPVIPRIADATAEGRKPLFLDLVAEGGVGWKFERARLLVRGRDVALETQQPIAVLEIEA